MFTVYPSNRLEYLASLLFALLREQAGSVLAPHRVIVESHGIRHWLQMKLAEEAGIAMNLQFQMPAGFVWDIARNLLKEPVPQVSTYGESILVWRIERILASDEFMCQPAAERPTRYWRDDDGRGNPRKRYQLAAKLASLFEQYIKYRDEWIGAWDAGNPALASDDEPWQRLIWQQLVSEEFAGQPNVHPVYLQNQLTKQLAASRYALPPHVILFGLNTLPEPTLRFFAELSKQTQVHLFHLNPCVAYWGDLISDKAKTRTEQWQTWLTLDEHSEATNPLLANLGQQGKRFFSRLQEVASAEISAFDVDDRPLHAEEPIDRTPTVLQRVQQDILTLRNAIRPSKEAIAMDESIVISSAHNTLREIQALHDYLLHCFNEDTTLTPGDILVMCPDIETYAPYVDAVFRRPWQAQEQGEPPRLPCSIADRVLLEEEPLVAAFLDLLALPDSRFEVSQILDYLRIPAIQQRFGLDVDSLETIEWWLRDAAVHWGLNAPHKQRLANLTDASDTYTWQWGLERLLLGYAWGDQETVLAGRLTLPHVEGQAAGLLGNTFLLLEKLQFYTRELTQARTPSEWQHLLSGLLESLFCVTPEEQSSHHVIVTAIDQLASDTLLANFDAPVELAVVREWFSRQFSRPDTGNHFMTGQVTFCSMMPMRSIPFRIIAMLGLNNGEFPRQENPVSFDLLSQDTLMPGDRSRRSDDRYLFLETLISARERLYLSYLGRSSRNNEIRQPSLVLTELMTYLEQGYGWSPDRRYVVQQPLQPFSSDNFRGPRASFDARWARFAQPATLINNRFTLMPFPLPEDPVNIDELIRFYDDPLKWLATTRLGVTLTDEGISYSDTEPFDLDTLQRYTLRQSLMAQISAGEEITPLVERIKASGHVPETPVTDSTIEELANEARVLLQAIQHCCPASQGIEQARLEVQVAGVTLYAEVSRLAGAGGALLTRPAKVTPKDELRHWLYHLVVQAAAEQTQHTRTPEETHMLTYGKAFDKVRHARYCRQGDAAAQLRCLVEHWLAGANTPSVLHIRANALAQPEDGQPGWQQAWAGAFEGDPYFEWFFGKQYTFSVADAQRVQRLYASMAIEDALSVAEIKVRDIV